MDENFLQLNENKTEVILFGSKPQIDKYSAFLGHFQSNNHSYVKNLVFIFDSDLKFDKQINSVVRASFFQLKRLRKLKPFLTFKDLEIIIHAFISSRLDYCNALYAEISQSSLSRLQIVQNAAARFLTGTKKREHISPIQASLHWLPVKQRIDFKVITYVFKALHGLAPIYISELLSFYSPQRSLSSSVQLLLNVPKSRLKTKGDRSFSVYAPKLWNTLPLTIRASPTLSLFKASIKTYFFSQAYS